MHRRTPCVGICSTTYGDLVCRGCKRFAHEIVGWNGYSPEQQGQIETRLRMLRRGAAVVWVQIEDLEQTRAAAARMAVDLNLEDPESVLWELMRRSVRHQLKLEDLGLRLNPDRVSHQLSDSPTPTLPTGSAAANEMLNRDLRSLVTVIDREFYLRSIAHYERSYRVLVS